MKQYLELVKTVIDNGVRKKTRTGVDTLSYFGAFYKVDLTEGFPLLTTKKILEIFTTRGTLVFIRRKSYQKSQAAHQNLGCLG